VATRIEIKGQAECHRALTGLTGDLRDLSSLNADVARVLVSAISARAPVDSGALAGSFQGTGTRDTAEASSSLPYAGVQNYGYARHNIAGKHFAEAALAEAAPAAEDKYRAGIGKLCKKAEGK
jgi:hypothetical protein